VVITGCSGGGKSTLLGALAALGHATVPEPGRRIVRAGGPMPWDDPVGFARRAVEVALADREAARRLEGPVFFDRGLIDAASALEALTGEPAVEALGRRHRLHARVFVAPPWPELFVTDAERRHELAQAVAEHDRLRKDHARLGYEVVPLPRIPVPERAAFVLARSAP
jgi:predicted ATPase